jgi:hypothetical protein
MASWLADRSVAFTPSHGLARFAPRDPAHRGARFRRSQLADPDLPTPGPCLLVFELGCPRLSSSSRSCGTDLPRASARRHRLLVPLGSPSPVSRSVSACRYLGLRLSSHSRMLRACALSPACQAFPKHSGGSLVLVVGSTESSLLVSPPRRCHRGVSANSRLLGACAPPHRLSSEPMESAWFTGPFARASDPWPAGIPDEVSLVFRPAYGSCWPPPTKPARLFKHPREISSTPRGSGRTPSDL